MDTALRLEGRARRPAGESANVPTPNVALKSPTPAADNEKKGRPQGGRSRSREAIHERARVD
jgi:hypothetical protein